MPTPPVNRLGVPSLWSRIDRGEAFEPLKRPSGSRKRVAIIEDEALIAFDMMVMVERLGGEVIATASTEAEAIAIAATARPDVVLMDLRLAEGDGARAAERIRENSGTAVVFVTGAADRETQRRLARISSAPVVTKPFRTRDLCAAVLTAATAGFSDGSNRSGTAG